MEVRRQAKLNQVVCTLEGMATLLQGTPGDFAVVIHGDADCANVLMHGMDHPGAERFFCTHLSEGEAVAGRTLPVLRECLEALCAERAPAVIFVLGTCLSALVGDEVETVTRAVAAAQGVPVVALAGAGLRFVPQSAVVDRFARLLADAAPAADPRPRAVNLVGFDPGGEVIASLTALGVEVNAVLDAGASVADWQRLGRARWNVVLDEALFGGFAADCVARGQTTLEVAYPVGVAGTDRFYADVLAAVAPDADPATIPGGPRAAAQAAVAAARPTTAGVRLGYNLGSKKDLSPRTLAREGLTELGVFEELGFDVVLLVQGDDRPHRLAAVRQTLDGLGCAAPLAVFSDTVYFGGLCREQRVDLAYGSDHLRELTEAGGVGFLEHGALRPGYGGARANVARILAALDAARGRP